MNVEMATKLSFYNRHSIQRAEKCGCYFCIRVFDSKEVVEWRDNGNTAVCPNCEVDAVLPNVTDEKFLIQAAERFFR